MRLRKTIIFAAMPTQLWLWLLACQASPVLLANLLFWLLANFLPGISDRVQVVLS